MSIDTPTPTTGRPTTSDLHAMGREPLRVGVIVGSTRPTRRSLAIAQWVAHDATEPALRLEIVDLADVNLPLLDEPVAAAFERYEHDHTRRWSSLVAGFDAFILVCPEYNASFPAALKNALDYLFVEWKDKPVAFVGYGMSGGIRAVEQLRLVTAELQMVSIGPAVNLLAHQVSDGEFLATDEDCDARADMLGQLSRLTHALALLEPVRRGAEAATCQSRRCPRRLA